MQDKHYIKNSFNYSYDKLLLWNTLDNETEINNSRVGPNGTITGAIDYSPVKFNNGTRSNADSEYVSFDFGYPVGSNPSGTVEFWIKPDLTSLMALLLMELIIILLALETKRPLIVTKAFWSLVVLMDLVLV